MVWFPGGGQEEVGEPRYRQQDVGKQNPQRACCCQESEEEERTKTASQGRAKDKCQQESCGNTFPGAFVAWMRPAKNRGETTITAHSIQGASYQVESSQ